MTRLILPALLFAAAPDAPRVEVMDGGRRLSVSGKAIDTIAAAHAALLPTARRVCRDRPVRFGAFRFATPVAPVTSAPPEPSMEQELFCGGLDRVAPAARGPGWRPGAAEQGAALAAAYAYLQARDDGRYGQAYARLAARTRAASPLPEWRRNVAEFNARAGAVRARQVTEISWYPDPPDAPRPGLYVATDFSAEFDRMEFVCGYLTWFVEPDGRLSLVREERNFLERRPGRPVASIDRGALRAQMGCKD